MQIAISTDEVGAHVFELVDDFSYALMLVPRANVPMDWAVEERIVQKVDDTIAELSGCVSLQVGDNHDRVEFHWFQMEANLVGLLEEAFELVEIRHG
jgi:hypothetical protein